MIRRGRAQGWLSLPASALQPWARLNGAELHGVSIDDLPGRGYGVVAREEQTADHDNVTLMTVSRDLVLSLESVKEYAKVDKTLAELLENLGDFGQTTRGAILTFLLCQASVSCPDVASGGFVRTPFTEYVKFIPLNDLPTSWTSMPGLGDLLNGTTLGPALDAKMNSLQREYELLKAASISIPWCKTNWWRIPSEPTTTDDDDAKMAALLANLGEERDSVNDDASVKPAVEVQDGLINLDDWLQVDCFYRSRALEFPGIGDATVPVIDMANHASGNATSALYECDANGDAVLLLRAGTELKAGSEVTITYGDRKGACEMLFSYGFIEHGMNDARELFLDLDLPNDDPLARAKKHVAKSAPGFKLFHDGDGVIRWKGDFVWWIVVNEEDGLDFQVEQTNDGGRELKAFWRDEELVTGETGLKEHLKQDEAMWEIFRLRAIATLQARAQGQIEAIAQSEQAIQRTPGSEHERGSALIRSLRDLESKLLQSADAMFEEQKGALLQSPTVVQYLSRTTAEPAGDEDDFS